MSYILVVCVGGLALVDWVGGLDVGFGLYSIGWFWSFVVVLLGVCGCWAGGRGVLSLLVCV